MRSEKVYNPAEIEARWSTSWAKDKIYSTPDNPKKPVYVLGMFPYPSGDGLHTGHVRIYTATDVLARYMRMKGFDVLYPMGWDAFGLPAENAAIKAKTNPKKLVPKNETNFRRQMESVGLSYDWDKSFSTTDPTYYRWTQWLFLKLYGFKNDKGERLIYRKRVAINWCPFCKTGLANEEVLADGTHERCGTAIEQKLMPQWLMRITDYADPLLSDLDTYDWVDEEGKKRTGLDWPRGILEMQRNWIGKKTGARVRFGLKRILGQEDGKHQVEVFTTRLDTLYGVTFLAISPELASKWLELGWQATDEVKAFIETSLKKLEQQRLTEAKEKTGIDTGIVAVNPLSGEEVKVFVADYVLGSVGTGALMGVPAHDMRDFEFAGKHELPVRWVVEPENGKLNQGAFELDGVLANSKQFDGLTSAEARNRILEELEKTKQGNSEVNYHLRDWVFSRQRYWGEPMPLVYCPKCGDENGVVPLPESDLPLTLPDLETYEPTDSGQSPLAQATDWVNTTCPSCGGKARRETDTMPNWAGSCWYFLRFPDAGNNQEAWSTKSLDSWLPVSWYLGGAEHAVLHLLYARFWVKAFADLKLLNFREPFLRLRGVGLVLSEDGRKMSKSLGNVVNPDSVVEKFGADTLRLYELFMGPWDQAISWETRSLVGCYRFLERIWATSQRTLRESPDKSDPKLIDKLNLLTAKVGDDISAFKFNTAVAASMEFVNAWMKSKAGLAKPELVQFLLTVAPIVPFITEELYQEVQKGSIHLQAWPEAAKVELSEVTVSVAVNGKHRAALTLPATESKNQETVEKAARAEESVTKWLTSPAKVVFVPGRLINFVL